MGDDIQRYNPEDGSKTPKGVGERIAQGFAGLCLRVGNGILRRWLPETVEQSSTALTVAPPTPEVRYALPPIETAVGIPLSRYEILYGGIGNIDHFIVAFLQEAERLELVTEFHTIDRAWHFVDNKAVAYPFIKVVDFLDSINYPVSRPHDSREGVDSRYFYPGRSFTTSQVNEMFWALHIFASLKKYLGLKKESLIEMGGEEIETLRRQDKGMHDHTEMENFGRMLTKILLFFKQRKDARN